MPITSLSGALQISGQDLLTDSSTQQHALGQYAETSDGRGYRYCKVGATATVPGKLYVGADFDVVNHSPAGGLGVNAAVAIGGTDIVISTSTTLVLNELAGGFLSVGITPGQGYTYRIKSNTATSAATLATIVLDDPLKIALTTASKVVVVQHQYNGVVVSPGAASTGVPVGVANSIITAAYFGWLQTYGPCSILSGVATSISLPGVPVSPSASTAGSVIVSTAILPTVGWAMHLFTATEYNLVHLTLR
ncbi:MAG: hypothetical protein AAB706_00850 [Patescibacteria group bacterium]